MAPKHELTDFYPLFSALTRLETELWDATDARLRKECDLPLGRYEAMLIIDALGSCRVHDIATALSITVGGTSKLVDRIEAAGYCARKTNPGDRRSSLLELTAQGTALLERGRAVVAEELRRWFIPSLTEQEAGTMLELLAKVRNTRVTENSEAVG